MIPVVRLLLCLIHPTLRLYLVIPDNSCHEQPVWRHVKIRACSFSICTIHLLGRECPFGQGATGSSHYRTDRDTAERCRQEEKLAGAKKTRRHCICRVPTVGSLLVSRGRQVLSEQAAREMGTLRPVLPLAQRTVNVPAKGAKARGHSLMLQFSS